MWECALMQVRVLCVVYDRGVCDFENERILKIKEPE